MFEKATTMNWIFSLQNQCLSLIFVLLWYPVSSEYHESIFWSPLNPKFHFSKEDFKNNQAFHTQVVPPESNIIIICPNIATVLSANTKHQPKEDNLYENIWLVDKDEFHSCKINTKLKDNRLLHICDKPGKLNFYSINFTHVFNTKQGNASSIYIIATSNGGKESLNHTIGGHCKNEEDGLSLRIKFTLCAANSTGHSCKGQLPSSRNITNITKTCENTNISPSKANNESLYLWEVLAICLGVVLAISVITNIIVLFFICGKRNGRQGSTKKTSDEPMKSLIVEPYKSKHVKVSAAL